MNATRKQRLWLVIGVLTAAALAVTLIALALQRNMSYLFTPSQVDAGAAAGYQQFRLGAWSRPARSSVPPTASP